MFPVSVSSPSLPHGLWGGNPSGPVPLPHSAYDDFNVEDHYVHHMDADATSDDERRMLQTDEETAWNNEVERCYHIIHNISPNTSVHGLAGLESFKNSAANFLNDSQLNTVRLSDVQVSCLRDYLEDEQHAIQNHK